MHSQENKITKYIEAMLNDITKYKSFFVTLLQHGDYMMSHANKEFPLQS